MKHEMCERCFEELCNDCYQRLASFEGHAVEVLAIRLGYIGAIDDDDFIENPFDYEDFIRDWDTYDERFKKHHRAEAKQLLGLK